MSHELTKKRFIMTARFVSFARWQIYMRVMTTNCGHNGTVTSGTGQRNDDNGVHKHSLAFIMLIVSLCFECFRTACRIYVSWLQRDYGQRRELLAYGKEFASLMVAP
jgi:hypothetical protein